MDSERFPGLERRAAVHAALADPARLRITDMLADSDASPSELAAMLAMASNLLAHHLHVLEDAGIVARHRSQGDRRRTYLRLNHGALEPLSGLPGLTAQRVLFVCTGNSARSHLAAALWRQASGVPAASAGTHPAHEIDQGAIAAAQRHHLPLPRLRPASITAVREDGDLVVTVCDLAHEELGEPAALHWSVPDPVPAGDPASFDAAVTELAGRVRGLAPRLAPAVQHQLLIPLRPPLNPGRPDITFSTWRAWRRSSMGKPPRAGSRKPCYCGTVKNITVSVPDDVYRKARVAAAQRDTSVSALVVAYLVQLSGRMDEFARLEALQREIQAGIGQFRAAGRLSRDEVHDRAVR